MPKISTILLTYNSLAYIEKCLDSLLETMPLVADEFEIIVIDNGSTDGCVDLLKDYSERYSEVYTHYFTENKGTTVSRNVGLKQASGDYILILDSDAYVNRDALSELLALLNQNPEWGLISPKLIYPDGRFQISVDTFPTFSRKLKRFLFLKEMEKSTGQYGHQQCVDYSISAFWLIKKEVLDRVGLLDEKIFYSPEDVDYCIRVWKAGYKIVYEPSVYVVHDAQEISRGFKINKFTLSHAKGLLYLFLKHRYFLGLRRLYKDINRFA